MDQPGMPRMRRDRAAAEGGVERVPAWCCGPRGHHPHWHSERRFMVGVVDTDVFSARLRERSIRIESGRLLMARIEGSAQEGDLSEPPNCGGFGRIRHFRMATQVPWPPNPLPVLPAAHRLGVDPAAVMTAQVFQNASCNWRCWYCFVPFELLSANERTAGWLTAGQMVDL